MFDLSFGKLLLVLIIALLVLGPARLPEAIKTVASWIKALRRLSATVQLELNKELRLQELQDSLHKAEKSGLDNITPEIRASIEDLKRIADSIQKDFYNSSTEMVSATNQLVNEKREPQESQNSHKDPSARTNTEIGKDQHAE